LACHDLAMAQYINEEALAKVEEYISRQGGR